MTTTPATPPTYYACPAQSFRAEFGVCRGEAISSLDHLHLGDVYQVKLGAEWSPVTSCNSACDAFSMELAANLPCEELTTLAHLIFMTTTGRRADVYAAMSQGQLYLVSETTLQMGSEYVLIDSQARDAPFAPVVVPSPMVPAHAAYAQPAHTVPVRLRVNG
ncbi:hypothetical protein [Marivita hallyeonensis]|uniref:Hint domain-containing protein n=1 Tax=Marivita hallyeonensis TaxID=996342 RepID=A0A1M5RGY1_9RHOB|nr:hypothetical protein [Marivita hallyeonensis]SHH25309.1 hypothetical protein SAMN05443551_1750 [Marivita hallyeonensis]